MSIKVSTIKDKFVSDIYCAENITIDISALDSFIGVASLKEEEYKGNYFLMDMDTFIYFHTMVEGIAQYAMLKEIIEDLQIVPIVVSNDSFKINKINKFYLDALKPFNITEKDIIDLCKIKPTFERVYYYTTRANSFLEKLDIPQGKELYGEVPFFVDGYYALRKIYAPYLEKDMQLPKKIFLSRLKKNEEIREAAKLYLEHGLYGKPLHKLVEQLIENYGSERYFIQMLAERHIEREEEELLEDYFRKNTYAIIDPEELTFFEQINLYYNATHVAAMRGAGLLNTLFCDPDAHIFILDTNQDYIFPYREICSIFDHNVYEIPFRLELKKYMQRELFCTRNILGILKTHYADKI
jgi:hypothetical protein